MIFLAMVICGLSGCAAQKPVEWSAVGGSRSDATVKLQYSFKYGAPNPDINQAIHLAKSRCVSWGYASAELFGRESKVCSGSTEQGLLGSVVCNGEWVVTKEFQCTGDGVVAKKPINESVVKEEPAVEEDAAPVKKTRGCCHFLTND